MDNFYNFSIANTIKLINKRKEKKTINVHKYIYYYFTFEGGIRIENSGPF